MLEISAHDAMNPQSHAALLMPWTTTPERTGSWELSPSDFRPDAAAQLVQLHQSKRFHCRNHKILLHPCSGNEPCFHVIIAQNHNGRGFLFRRMESRWTGSTLLRESCLSY